MLRSRTLALVFPTLMMVTPLLAQTPGTSPGNPPASSIVTISFNNAVLGTAEAQRDLGALQKKYSPREQQLQKLNNDIEASRKLLADSTAKLSESEKNQRLQDLNTKDKQLQRDSEDFKNDSQQDSQQAFQRVAQKMYSFLQEYAPQHGYSAVLERGTDAAPVVWYAANNVDITDQLTKAYNLRPGASATGLPDKPAASHPQPSSPKKP